VNVDAGFAANTALLEETVRILGDVADELVFIGGCATGLLVTSVRAQGVRVTTDVDVVAEVTSILEYHALEQRIAAKGFQPDPEVICRWRVGDVQLDVMPSGPNVLGFQNRWYPLAMATAVPTTLPGGRRIQLVTGPLFLATKLEAFRDRGAGDYLASHDIEDIVTVVDGRPELLADVAASNNEIREYLQLQMAELLANDAFLSAVAGHLPGDPASQARVPLILERLRELARA
jgi:predicted nucleotidyltransferase